MLTLWSPWLWNKHHAKRDCKVSTTTTSILEYKERIKFYLESLYLEFSINFIDCCFCLGCQGLLDNQDCSRNILCMHTNNTIFFCTSGKMTKICYKNTTISWHWETEREQPNQEPPKQEKVTKRKWKVNLNSVLVRAYQNDVIAYWWGK